MVVRTTSYVAVLIEMKLGTAKKTCHHGTETQKIAENAKSFRAG